MDRGGKFQLAGGRHKVTLRHCRGMGDVTALTPKTLPIKADTIDPISNNFNSRMSSKSLNHLIMKIFCQISFNIQFLYNIYTI